MSMRMALAKSKNMVSIRILQTITPQYAQDYITRFGFDADRHPPYLTMALGAGSATPLQMARAFSVFATGGYRTEPYVIQKVVDDHAADLDELHGQGVEGHAGNGPAQSRGRRHSQSQRKRPSVSRWATGILFSRKRSAGTGSGRSGSADHRGREKPVVLTRPARTANASRPRQYLAQHDRPVRLLAHQL